MEKSITTAKKSMFDLKALTHNASSAGMGILGFVAGNLAYNKGVPASFKTGVKSIVASLLFFVLGVTIAANVKSDHIKRAGEGLAMYAGIKTINNITGAGVIPGADGSTGGLAGLPEGVKKFLNNIVPSVHGLSAADLPELRLASAEQLQNRTVEAEYELLNGADSPLTLTDSSLLLGIDDEPGSNFSVRAA